MKGVLVRTLWPSNVPQLARGDEPLHLLGATEVVPEDYNGLLAWVTVHRLPGIGSQLRHYTLVYEPCIGPHVQEFDLRLQGFVRKANLWPLGDWNQSAACS